MAFKITGYRPKLNWWLWQDILLPFYILILITSFIHQTYIKASDVTAYLNCQFLMGQCPSVQLYWGGQVEVQPRKLLPPSCCKRPWSYEHKAPGFQAASFSLHNLSRREYNRDCYKILINLKCWSIEHIYLKFLMIKILKGSWNPCKRAKDLSYSCFFDMIWLYRHDFTAFWIFAIMTKKSWIFGQLQCRDGYQTVFVLCVRMDQWQDTVEHTAAGYKQRTQHQAPTC